MTSALERACEIAGGSTKLAIALGKRKAVISQWKSSRVPAEMCPNIESITGVRCEELRSDVNWSVLRKTPRKQKAEA
jgi:DNA-binding transcriptional regulator YdaS (Cro superfamily)